ncbi:hypothetical protein [Adhaeribacter aquaticus]|uniref:hypothetical protein n=1 Tax=Adhaeribacter aquaticus TaxID=299567 RepID=UPI00040C7965|nr:hypothetical protein [Adhaeribacter aquaticus]
MNFEFAIGGYDATNYLVKYTQGILKCYTSDYPSPPFPDDFLVVKGLNENAFVKVSAFYTIATGKKCIQMIPATAFNGS